MKKGMRDAPHSEAQPVPSCESKKCFRAEGPARGRVARIAGRPVCGLGQLLALRPGRHHQLHARRHEHRRQAQHPDGRLQRQVRLAGDLAERHPQGGPVWAQQTNINFAVVPDNGAGVGTGSYQQGDPGFGDIRIGGYNYGNSTLASAFMPPPANNFSVAGDFDFNTGQTFNLNRIYDLFTVAAHEMGHSLGLHHSSVYSSQMYPYYGGAKSALATDDINGIRSIYGGARAADGYDAVASNGTTATATDITSLIDPTALTALVSGLDITTTTDQDFYRFVAPVGLSGTTTVGVVSKGLSLLSPLVTIYNAAGTSIGTTSSTNYGATLSLIVGGLTAGETYYVKVDGVDATAFGTGAYALTLNFGTGPSPSVPLPNTQRHNGNPIPGGGGQGIKVDPETLVTYTAGIPATRSGRWRWTAGSCHLARDQRRRWWGSTRGSTPGTSGAIRVNSATGDRHASVA
ncbi:MAG: matrixin family metalloprotease [Singulisphaera sp.]